LLYCIHMTQSQKKAVFLLRMALGALFLYAGIAKLMNPEWTSVGYLAGAQTLSGFYGWLALPQNITWVDMLNEWGLFLVGATLMLGVGTRIAASLGVLIMALYYIPTLNFPYAGEHAYIVDEHIIYIAGFIVLVVFNAGIYWGIDGMIQRSRQLPTWIKKCLWCK